MVKGRKPQLDNCIARVGNSAAKRKLSKINIEAALYQYRLIYVEIADQTIGRLSQNEQVIQ